MQARQYEQFAKLRECYKREDRNIIEWDISFNLVHIVIIQRKDGQNYVCTYK